MGRDNLEHGWIGSEDRGGEEDEEVFTCDWCGEKIYSGSDYYNLAGERVCKTCVDDCARIA